MKILHLLLVQVGEATLKVFVYNETIVPELVVFLQNSPICKEHVFGSEVLIPEYIAEHLQWTTTDWTQADLFYVPMNIACIYYANARSNSTSMDEDLLHSMQQHLDAILYSLPYYRPGRRNHVFNLFFKGLFPGWRIKLKDAIILTPETEVEFEISSKYFESDCRIEGEFPPYDATRDIVIPPYMHISHLQLFASHAQINRPWLVSFFGKRWIDVDEGINVRQRMIDVFSQRSDSYIHAVDTVSKFVPLTFVADIMGKSKFCLIPRGRSAWTTRFYDAWWAGCIPIVLSDYFVLPFAPTSVNPKLVMIQWPTSSIDSSFIDYLESLSVDDINKFQAEIVKVRHIFVYPTAIETLLRNLSA